MKRQRPAPLDASVAAAAAAESVRAGGWTGSSAGAGRVGLGPERRMHARCSCSPRQHLRRTASCYCLRAAAPAEEVAPRAYPQRRKQRGADSGGRRGVGWQRRRPMWAGSATAERPPYECAALLLAQPLQPQGPRGSPPTRTAAAAAPCAPRAAGNARTRCARRSPGGRAWTVHCVGNLSCCCISLGPDWGKAVVAALGCVPIATTAAGTAEGAGLLRSLCYRLLHALRSQRAPRLVALHRLVAARITHLQGGHVHKQETKFITENWVWSCGDESKVLTLSPPHQPAGHHHESKQAAVLAQNALKQGAWRTGRVTAARARGSSVSFWQEWLVPRDGKFCVCMHHMFYCSSAKNAEVYSEHVKKWPALLVPNGRMQAPSAARLNSERVGTSCKEAPESQ
eukprot:16095-Pelagomonas_calceolata.AAC.2